MDIACPRNDLLNNCSSATVPCVLPSSVNGAPQLKQPGSPVGCGVVGYWGAVTLEAAGRRGAWVEGPQGIRTFRPTAMNWQSWTPTPFRVHREGVQSKRASEGSPLRLGLSPCWCGSMTCNWLNLGHPRQLVAAWCGFKHFVRSKCGPGVPGPMGSGEWQ